MNRKSNLKKHFEKTQTCWEFMKCPKDIRKKCETYKLGFGRDCWLLADDTIADGYCFSKKYDDCFNCSWSKKNNP